MKTLKLWACQANCDRTEGRGPMEDICYASSKDIALKIVNDPVYYRKHGVMGVAPWDDGKQDVSERNLIVYEDYSEYVDSVNIEAKKAVALGKLTNEEKKLLGLIK